MEAGLDLEDLDDSLKIRRISESSDSRVAKKRESLNPNFIQPHFVIGITAQMGSGKTTLICNLVVRYRKFFDKVIFISPSADLDEKIEKCLRAKDVSLPTTRENLEGVIEKLKQDTFDAKRDAEEGAVPVPTLTQLITGRQPRRKKKKIEDTLLVLDDASVNKAIFDKSSLFAKFLFSHRKFSTSIIMVTHYHRLMPLPFRAVLNALIIFQIGNEQELKGILEEHGLGIDKDMFRRIVDFATKEPFSFLVINKNRGIRDGRFTKRFEVMIKPRLN